MQYKTSSEIAISWEIADRTVRNYCAQGRVEGALLDGKTWKIPEDAKKPERKQRKGKIPSSLLERLKMEKENQLPGGIYHKVQIELTYNSNHIEGSKLSKEMTQRIFETNTIGVNESIGVDDVIETMNHFRCVDLVIDSANYSLNESLIKQFHNILKSSTSDSRKPWFAVGDYKRLENEVGNQKTASVSQVSKEMKNLLTWYKSLKMVTIEDLIEFHVRFERIHPFQDGNGRVGRLILFKECLKHNIVPFIIKHSLKEYYYRGLYEWDYEKGYLIDTCLFAQDEFKKVLDYYHISY